MLGLQLRIGKVITTTHQSGSLFAQVLKALFLASTISFGHFSCERMVTLSKLFDTDEPSVFVIFVTFTAVLGLAIVLR